MWHVRRRPVTILLVGVLFLLVLALACSKAAAPAAAPSAAPATSSVATPAPAAPTTGTAPTPAPAVTAAASAEDSRYVVQFFNKYHPDKLRLWTKAFYGGELTGTGGASPVLFDSLNQASLQRPVAFGSLLGYDIGRCTMLKADGSLKDDFSTCDGRRANNMAPVLFGGIAQKWAQPDPVTYVFTIRKGVMWPAIAPMTRANRELTAQDVAFWLQTIKRQGAWTTLMAPVANIEMVDQSTVKVTLSEPNAAFLFQMGNPSLGIFSKECFDEKDCIQTKIISPGPFLLKENETRVRSVWVKNPEYYLKGLPYLDGIRQIYITDPAAQFSGFVTGQLDFWSAPVPSAFEAMLKRVPGAQGQAELAVTGQTSFSMRVDKAPFNDARVRQAFSMAIDREAAYQACCEGYANTPMSIPWFDVGLEHPAPLSQLPDTYRYNPEKAKELWKAAGMPNSGEFRVVMNTSSGFTNDALLAISASVKKTLGVDLMRVVVDPVSFSAMVVSKDWGDGFYYSIYGVLGGAAFDSNTFLSQYYTNSPLNIENVADPKFDALYLAQRKELDPIKRRTALWNANNYEMSQVYRLWIGSYYTTVVMQPWVENGAGNVIAWASAFNVPSYVTMLDISKVPKR